MNSFEKTFSEMDLDLIEQDVEDLPGHYFATRLEALYISVEDYNGIFLALPEIKSWIELGSGVGTGPLLFASRSPENSSIGIEFDKTRFQAALDYKEKHLISNAHFILGDVAQVPLPVGDAYFLYFPTGPVLDKLLSQLGCLSQDFVVVAIESHGDLIPRLNCESWLFPIKEIPLMMKRHYPNAVVFKKISQRKESFFDLSFKSLILLIEEDDGRQWIGDTLGMAWDGGERHTLMTPPRTFLRRQVKKVINLDDLKQNEKLCVDLRARGCVKIFFNGLVFEGFVRKIYVKPRFTLELSDGRQVEWDSIEKIFFGDFLCYDRSF